MYGQPWMERFRCNSSPLWVKRLPTMRIIKRKVSALRTHPETSRKSSNKFPEKVFYYLSVELAAGSTGAGPVNPGSSTPLYKPNNTQRRDDRLLY